MTEEQDKLVEDNIALVYYVYKKYFHRYDDSSRFRDDYISAGMLGLVKAAGTYDQSKKIAFSSYGCRCIFNEMAMFRRDVQFKHQDTLSLSMPIQDAKEDTLTLEDTIPSYDERTAMDIFNELKLLPEEREILIYRYQGYTIREIAQMMNITHQRVSQRVRAAYTRYLKDENFKKRGRKKKSQ